MNSPQYIAASFWARTASGILNISLNIAFSYFFLLATGRGSLNTGLEWQALALTYFAVYFANDIILQNACGANLAKLLLGMKVVDSRHTEQLIGLRRSVLRSFTSLVSVLMFGLGLLAMAFNKNHKTLHDLLSSSLVIDTSSSKSKLIRKFVKVVLNLALLIILFFVGQFSYYAAKASYAKFLNPEIIASYDSQIFQQSPKAVIELSLGSKQDLIVLIKHRSLVSSNFSINLEQNVNYISKQLVQELQLANNASQFVFNWEQAKKHKFPFLEKVTLAELIFQGKNRDLLTANNIEFIVSEDRNSFSKDFFKMFDYKLMPEENKLNISLLKDEQELFKNTTSRSESDEIRNSQEIKAIRDYKIHSLQQIRQEWQEYSKSLPYPLLEEFIHLKHELKNVIELEIETKLGNITGVTFTEPSDNDHFNEFCNQFFQQDLARFKNIPKALKESPSFTITYTLVYRDNL